MSTIKQRDRAEAVERLREWLKPGDTVYCVLRHVSRSGMFRVIDLKIIGAEGDMLHIGWNAARALDYGYDRRREGLRVSGAGMDMGFHVVYSLSSVLFHDGYALKSRWI